MKIRYVWLPLLLAAAACCAKTTQAAGDRGARQLFRRRENRRRFPRRRHHRRALPQGEATGLGGGDITVNQMYVQYQIPANGSRHVPVVMVHGCCLSSKTWETTPDGRMGWNEYFVRKDRPVYLADQVVARPVRLRSVHVQRGEGGHASAQPASECAGRPAIKPRGPSSASGQLTARLFRTSSFRWRPWTSSTSK